MKNLTVVENYENGGVTFIISHVTRISSCFEEALDLLHNPEADKSSIQAYLAGKTFRLLQKAGIPVPNLDFYPDLCEVHCVTLKMCGREIDIMPKDTMASLKNKWEEIMKTPATN